MKNLKFMVLVLLASLVVLTVSCKDDEKSLPDPMLSVSSGILNLEAFSSDTVLVISCNYDWTATRPEADTWCKLKQENEKLHIALDWNPDVAERSTRVTVTVEAVGMKKEEYIDITQNAADSATVSLSVDRLVFDAEGETREVSVAANMPDYTWKLSAADDSGRVVEGVEVNWCTVEKEGVTLILTAVENPDLTGRYALLEVTAGQGSNLKSAVLPVSQQGQQPELHVADSIVLPATSEAVRLEVTTNLSSWTYDVLLLDARKVAVERVERENALLLKNLDFATEPYRGKLEITAGEGTDAVSKIVIIKKEAAPVASVSVEKQNVFFTNGGGTIELTVEANLEGWLYAAPEEAGWLTVTKEGDRLKLTASAGGEDRREAVVVLKVGGGSNFASMEVKVTQAGTKPFVGLSESSLRLDADGAEQVVEVVSNTGEWKVTPDGGAAWWHYRVEGNKLYIEADRLEAGSRSATVMVGGGADGTEAPVILTIYQTKPYAVWDYYILNGEKLGIVFEVSDGGRHGKVLSLKANHEVINYAGEEGSPGMAATNRIDGRENVKAMKAQGDFEYNYPGAAWCDLQNDENGAPGWYLPAIEELRVLDLMFSNGEEWTGGDFEYSETALAQREKINRMITDAGGVPFVFDYSSAWQLVSLMSSTEDFYQGNPVYWIRGLFNGAVSPTIIVADYGAAVRPVLAF